MLNFIKFNTFKNIFTYLCQLLLHSTDFYWVVPTFLSFFTVCWISKIYQFLAQSHQIYWIYRFWLSCTKIYGIICTNFPYIYGRRFTDSLQCTYHAFYQHVIAHPYLGEKFVLLDVTKVWADIYETTYKKHTLRTKMKVFKP